MSFQPPLREDLLGLEPYGAPQLEVPVLLNVNENPYPLPDELCREIGLAVEQLAPRLHRYPDREAMGLRTALLDYLRVESRAPASAAVDQVWAANGSNEVMHHLFSAFGGPGRTAISFDPTYSMYPEYARDTFTRYEHVPRRADFGLDMDAAMAAVDDLRPSLVIVSSPNNPTGTACGPESLEALANRAGAYGGLLVVDEAYAEFRAPGRSSACELVGGQPNLVVVRTMSKAFAMAGLRLGYALAGDRSIVDAMRIVRLPYHLSALTQTAARVAIERAELLQWQLASIRAERDRLTGWLEERDLSPAPSDANFVFFGPFDDAEAVWHGLLEHGVLIRRTGPAGWLRVTIGTPEENGRFREALSAVLEGST